MSESGLRYPEAAFAFSNVTKGYVLTRPYILPPGAIQLSQFGSFDSLFCVLPIP